MGNNFFGKKKSVFRIAALLFIVFWIIINPFSVTAKADDASAKLGSAVYEAQYGEEFPIGIYITGESNVGDYHLELIYDTTKLQYVSGATSVDASMGVLTFDGTGSDTTVKLWLTMKPIAEGDGSVAISNVVAIATHDGEIEEFNITEMGGAPVRISKTEGDANVPEEEIPAEEIPQEEPTPTPTVSPTATPTATPTPMASPTATPIATPIATVSLTPEITPASTGGVDVTESPITKIIENQESEQIPEINHTDISDESSIQVSEFDEQNSESDFGIFNGKLSLEGNRKYIIIALFAGLAIIIVAILFIVIRSIVNESKLQHEVGIDDADADEKEDNTIDADYDTAKKESQVEDSDFTFLDNIDEDFDAAIAATDKKSSKPASLKSQSGNCTSKVGTNVNARERKPVIRVKSVTMNFRVTTSNVSGIKEYIIQKLKHQMKYREFLALDDVSFDVFKGEVVGIIGTNGSGKSTLLRIISGALSPTSGSVEVDRRKIQLLTLGTGFDMELTARENVYLNGSIIGYTKDYIDSHYEKIVEFAELEGFMEEKVKNFSSGMVSRLGFAIATCGKAAEILILDEVLSVGDEFFRQKSLKRIKEMIHGGSTVLMVSHSMNTIIENCTKVVWIEKGKLMMVGDAKEVCGKYCGEE